jgi:hypothetical protein
MSFIKEVVREITEKHTDTNAYVIVLPSRRAKRFFLKEIAQSLNRPVYAPTLLTFGEFVEEGLPGEKADTTHQLFYLFTAAQNVQAFKEITFDEFVPWAEILLHDFQELNHQLVSVSQAFDNVSKIKQLESWNLESDYSPQQERELVFWEHIPLLYEAFLNELNRQNKTTSSLKSKGFADDVLSRIDLSKHYYFIGFNALSKAESTIISKLTRINKATVFFEISKEHFENTYHEAGYFIRRNIAQLQIEPPRFLRSCSRSEEEPIEVVECVQASSQIKVVSTELEKLSDEALSRTAVVLADENLLIPLLKSIPKAVKKANITVGLSLIQTPVKALIDRVFSIQENKKRLRNSRLYHKDLWGLLRNPLVRHLMSEEEQSAISLWESESVRNNVVFHDLKEIPTSSTLKQIITLFSEDWEGDFRSGIHRMAICVNNLSDGLPETATFERQLLETLMGGLEAFLLSFPQSFPQMSLATFRRIFQNHWGKCAIGYHGNPTKGLQVMGLLESRMLSFGRVFIIGMNEGTLPKTNPIDSHLPMDLRRALELPTPREKQGLFAHHFYRLLYDAKQVLLTYKSTEEGFGMAERSRYITQLLVEEPSGNIVLKHYFGGQLGLLKSKAFSLTKNQDIHSLLEHYFSGNVSASAFLTYLDCPLNFYYKYIIGLGEEKELEEDLDMSSVGTLVHKVLEELYSPFAQNDNKGVKKPDSPPALSEDRIKGLLSMATARTRAHFIAFLNGDETRVSQGKNWLTLKMATRLVINTLEEDMKTVIEQQLPIEIIQLETPLKADMRITNQGQERILHWIGYVDRIDKIGEAFRIIDYKTGIVKDNDVEFSVKDDLLESFSKTKHALQLMVYSFLFKQNFGFFPTQSLIFSLPTQTAIQKALNTGEISDHERMQLLNEFVTLIMDQLFDKETPLEHNPEAYYCKFC